MEIKHLKTPQVKKIQEGLGPHSWAIAAIILILSYLYYVNLSMIDRAEMRWDWLWNLIVFEFNHSLNGSLFCIPFIYAALIFGWRGILTAWFSVMVLNLPRMLYLSFNVASFVTNFLFLLIPLLIVLLIALLRSWRDDVRKAAAQRERERQTYVELVLKAQEDERKRISREIHDDTTQRLWIASNDLQRVVTDKLRNSFPETVAEIEDIRQRIGQISYDAKRLSLALRPGILDDLGLIPAMRWLVDQINRENITEGQINVIGTPRTLSNDVSTHVYRITQEALNNARRHSGASRITVTLQFSDSNIRLTISDNGKGIPPYDFSKLSEPNKLGMIGIQERARLLGGTFNIDSSDNRGTTLSIEFSG